MLETVIFLIYLLTNHVRAISTPFKAHDDIVRPTPSSQDWSSLSDLIAKSVNERALFNSSLSLRKFDYDDPDTRLAQLWNWDYWCRLQPVVGTCDENIRKYYYDLKTDSCKYISYSGCSGGKNLFSSKKDCERTCIGANDMLKPTISFEDQLDCYYQPDPGVCLGHMEQLFYDVNMETCRTFIYGGCGGNANRFTSTRDCLLSCKGSNERR